MSILNPLRSIRGTSLLYGPAQSYQSTVAREIYCAYALAGTQVLAFYRSQNDADAFLEQVTHWQQARELKPRELVTSIIEPRYATPENYLEAIAAKVAKGKARALLVRDTSCELNAPADNPAWLQIAKEISLQLDIGVLSITSVLPDHAVASQTSADVILRCRAGHDLTVNITPEKPRGIPIKLIGKKYPNGALLFDRVDEPIPAPPLVPIMPSNSGVEVS